MFNQVVGDGANLFVIIIACVVGFVSALGFIDFRKVKKDEEEGSNSH